VTPQEAEAIYWKAQKDFSDAWLESSGKPLVQAQMQEVAWEAVIKALRKHYEEELERLREENRMLKTMLADRITADATR